MSIEPVNRLRIHRFGDLVAVRVDSRETVYMDQEAAEMLSYVLGRYSRDIDTNHFTDSEIGTTNISSRE